MTAFDIAVPISITRKTYEQAFNLRRYIDGLAYGAQRDAIYLVTARKLWRSEKGSMLEAVDEGGAWAKIALMEPQYMNYPVHAWVLPSGGYVNSEKLYYDK